MPDESGKLTTEEKREFGNWISAKLGDDDLVRPICKSKRWHIGGHLVLPVTVGANYSLRLDGVSYPQVMLISSDCGLRR